MPLIASLIYWAIQGYILLIFVHVLGSWFPQWRHQNWFRFVNDVVEPYLNLFKQLPLRFGMFDFTPMVAIMVLWLFQSLVQSVLMGGGMMR